MTNEMSQEDKDFLDKFLNELKNIGIPGGEAYLSKLGEYVSKMPNAEIAHFGKLFRLYGYTGVFFAIQDSIKQGSADPLYKYALGTIATIAAAPFVVGTGKAVLAAIVLSYLVNKSWEAGEWLAENQEEITEYLRDITYGWSKKIEKIVGSDFDYTSAVSNVYIKKQGVIIDECTLVITTKDRVYIIDDDESGTINYASDSKDSIIYLGEGHNVVHSGSGNDTIYGGGDIDSIVTGRGDSIVYTYGGNDVVNTSGSIIEDTNYIYLGGGSDKYTGGIGIDIVDGGSTRYSNTYGQDTDKDINTIDLGGGDDKYYGGDGKDIVDGGSSQDVKEDTNIIYLGANSDKYTGGIGIDIVDGGFLSDCPFIRNTTIECVYISA